MSAGAEPVAEGGVLAFDLVEGVSDAFGLAGEGAGGLAGAGVIVDGAGDVFDFDDVEGAGGDDEEVELEVVMWAFEAEVVEEMGGCGRGVEVIFDGLFAVVAGAGLGEVVIDTRCGRMARGQAAGEGFEFAEFGGFGAGFDGDGHGGLSFLVGLRGGLVVLRSGASGLRSHAG